MKKFAMAVALLMISASAHAQDTVAPAAPAASQNEPAASSVARPSIAPKTAEPGTTTDVAEPAARPQRRHVHRSPRRHGAYRTAYWQPFPIYWPHFHRSRIHWNRIPWIFRF